MRFNVCIPNVLLVSQNYLVEINFEVKHSSDNLCQLIKCYHLETFFIGTFFGKFEIFSSLPLIDFFGTFLASTMVDTLTLLLFLSFP